MSKIQANNNNESTAQPGTIEIKYYGVRGSLPAPMLPSTVEEKTKTVLTELLQNKKYKGMTISNALKEIPFHLKSTFGGNTSCAYLKIKKNHIILDAGSGMRVLGLELMGQEFGKGEGKAKVFFTHTHLDLHDA